jgi:chitinase
LATYTINLQKVSAPTFSIPGGNYTETQSITVSCATDGATIRYTVDGSIPTSSSTACSGPLNVSNSTVTIKARAFKAGMVDSDLAKATYVVEPVVPEVLTNAGLASLMIGTLALTLVFRKRKQTPQLH